MRAYTILLPYTPIYTPIYPSTRRPPVHPRQRVGGVCCGPERHLAHGLAE